MTPALEPRPAVAGEDFFTPAYAKWLCAKPLKPIPQSVLEGEPGVNNSEPSLAEVVQRALVAMDRVTIFVTSREQIKKPEGHAWWSEEIAALAVSLDSAQVRQAERDAEVERLRNALAAAESAVAWACKLRAAAEAHAADMEINATRLFREKMMEFHRAEAVSARASKAVERVKALEEALRPFAGMVHTSDESPHKALRSTWATHNYAEFTTGDIQRAAALLSTAPDLGGEANDTTRGGGDE